MVDRLHRRLTELSAFVNGWVSGPLNIASLPMRIGPDSQATLERYGEERTFVLPDGTTRVFSFHVKLGLTTRIYVYFRGPGECYIGHIGPHLRTVKFPN